MSKVLEAVNYTAMEDYSNKLEDSLVQNFVIAAFNNSKFYISYKFEPVEVIFTLLTKEESDEIDSTIERKVLNKEIKTNVAEKREREYLRIKHSILKLSIKGVHLYEKGRNEVSQLDTIIQTEASYNIIRSLFKKFENTCTEIIKHVTDENFFTATSGVID